MYVSGITVHTYEWCHSAGCANEADVAIIMDVSGSIRAHNFEYAREFTQGLIDILDIEGGRIRLAMVTFSDDVYPQFDLDDYVTRLVRFPNHLISYMQNIN